MVVASDSTGEDVALEQRTLSRKGVMQPHDIDLNNVVASLLELFERTLGESISIQTHLSPDPLDVFADPGMLEQVLMNLTINARDAMPHGGRLVVETGMSELEATTWALCPTSHRVVMYGSA